MTLALIAVGSVRLRADDGTPSGTSPPPQAVLDRADPSFEAVWPSRPQQTLTLDGWYASQAALADTEFVYGISNTGVVRLDRRSGAVLARSPTTYRVMGDTTATRNTSPATDAADTTESANRTGGDDTRPLIHLNAGLIHRERMYLFHSNYVSPPGRFWSGPDEGAILACDRDTLDLRELVRFGDIGGSLTWAIPVTEDWPSDSSSRDRLPSPPTGPAPTAADGARGGVAGVEGVRADDARADRARADVIARDAVTGWVCHFARYGEANDQSFLAQFDRDGREVARWTYPVTLTVHLDRHSLSGGVLDRRAGRTDLLASGHHHPKAYRLRLPPGGGVMDFLAVEAVPFDGQAFGVDPVTGGLVGIVRGEKQIVFSGRRIESTLRTATRSP